MDDFLETTDDFDSRSQLCRAALDNFIDLLERKGDEILVSLPGAFLDMVDKFVEKGFFDSRSDAVTAAVRNYFTKDRIARIAQDLEVIGKTTEKLPTIRYKDKDQIIPR
jgi:Arc/MetJ-type ribon-helix-helix transcriptional regulator